MQQYPNFNFVMKPSMFRASSVPIIRGYPLYTRQLVRVYQLPCVQWITPDDGHRRCPKHRGFYDKNKIWILMHLVGYFYETYHDARSPDHKVLMILTKCTHHI